MSGNVLHARAEHKQNRREVTYDHHGNPYPTNLKKHLRLAQQYEREDDPGLNIPAQQIILGVAAVGVSFIAYQVALHVFIGGVQ
jgi:hypothetical protein